MKQLILLRSQLGDSLTLALNRSETMKIMLLAAATLSLGVGAANADNKGNANTNEGNANTRYTQTIREAARRPPRRFPRRPLFLLFRRRRAGRPTVDPALLTRSAERASGRGSR